MSRGPICTIGLDPARRALRILHRPRPAGATPGIPGSWPMVIAGLVLAGCSFGDGPNPLSITTEAPRPTAPVAASTTTPPTIPTTTSSTSAPTTSSTSSTTTTTTIPPRPWQIEGRDYYFPVQPPADTAYSAVHHDYPATDIFGPPGTPVVAVTAGVIEDLRRDDPWSRETDDPAERGGRFVSLIGDDGVRYYCSHLESVDPGITVGGRVAAGQLIGALGNSGNAASTSPHIHFGLSRPTFAGDWETRRGEIAPYEYLQAWTRGESATPILPGA